MRGSGGRRASAAGRQRAASSSLPQSLPSPWQAPGDTLLPVLELLLAQAEGTRWLRVASHVCSAWRSMSLEVLLADTAISKPPLEDFRAIGRQQAAAQPPAKADTVATQAAVVQEASASTGVEAMSKPCFDMPPGLQLAPALPGRAPPPDLAALALPSVRKRAFLELGEQYQQQQQQAQQQQQPWVQQTQPSLARPPTAAPAAPPRQQQRRQQRQAAGAGVPQGSIQSDVAAVGGRAAYASDSEGGSTLAQVPHKRQRRRTRRRGPSRGKSVEQPLSPQQQARLEQQQQRKQEEQERQQGGAPASTGPRRRKRSASAGEVDGPSRAAPAAQAKRARKGQRSQPAAQPAAAASPASAAERRWEKAQREDSGVSGSYAGLGGGDMEGVEAPSGAAGGGPAAAAAAQRQAAVAAPQQRSVGSGPVQAVFGFVRRIVGLGP